MQRKHYTEEEKNAVISQYASCGGEVKSMLAELGIPKAHSINGFANMIFAMDVTVNMILVQGISATFCDEMTILRICLQY